MVRQIGRGAAKRHGFGGQRLGSSLARVNRHRVTFFSAATARRARSSSLSSGLIISWRS